MLIKYWIPMKWYKSTAPSSPIHNRRFLSARPTRMSSVELPDDNEKSVSSASTSPCPSPVSYNLYLYRIWKYLYANILYNSKLRCFIWFFRNLIDSSQPISTLYFITILLDKKMNLILGKSDQHHYSQKLLWFCMWHNAWDSPNFCFIIF